MGQRILGYLFVITMLLVAGCIQNQPMQTSVPVSQAPIEPRLPEVLPGQLSKPATLVSLFGNAGSVKPQSEFETALDLEERLVQFRDNDFFRKMFYLSAFLNWGDYCQIEYNPYSQRFVFKMHDFALHLYANKNDRDLQTFSVLVAQASKDTGSYTGMNAFGVTKRVEKAKYNKVCLSFVNAYAVNNSEYIKREGYIDWLVGTSIKIPPEEAQILKPKLTIVYEFSPAVHYILGGGYALVGKNYRGGEPTLSSPYDITTEITILFGNLWAIYLVDKTTMKVYGMMRF